MLPRGLAARSGLRVGDRILAVNGQDVREATHQEAVSALLRPCLELVLLVRRDPPPPGMRELCIQKAPGERLGISIRGGAKGHAGNPCDPTDEGIFISKVSSPSPACPVGFSGREGPRSGAGPERGGLPAGEPLGSSWARWPAAGWTAAAGGEPAEPAGSDARRGRAAAAQRG